MESHRSSERLLGDDESQRKAKNERGVFTSRTRSGDGRDHGEGRQPPAEKDEGTKEDMIDPEIAVKQKHNRKKPSLQVSLI